MFFNNVRVFTLTFDQQDTSLRNESINYLNLCMIVYHASFECKTNQYVWCVACMCVTNWLQWVHQSGQLLEAHGAVGLPAIVD